MGLFNVIDMNTLVGVLCVLGLLLVLYKKICRRHCQAALNVKLDAFLKQFDQVNQTLNAIVKEQRQTVRLLGNLVSMETSYEQREEVVFDASATPSNRVNNMEEVSNQNKLYVGNIDYTATESELAAHFTHCGTIESVNIPVNRYTGRARGFGFVTFTNRSDAERAMTLNGSEFKGRQIQVNFAKERESA